MPPRIRRRSRGWIGLKESGLLLTRIKYDLQNVSQSARLIRGGIFHDDGDLGVVRDKKTRHAANRCKLTEHCIARSVTDTAWAWASPDPSLAAAVGAAGLEP